VTGSPGATDPSDADVPVDAAPTQPAGRSASRLLHNSAVMAIATTVSRLSGFVRSLVMIAALGTALFGDAFNVANTVPTSIYILVAGGALNSVFMPQLVRTMRRDPDGGEAFAQRLLTLVAGVLAVVVVVAVIAAPWIIRAYASDRLLDPVNRPYFDLSVQLARYCLPQVFFSGIYVVLGQVLNARDRFGPMMWAPLLNNVVSIAVFVTFMLVGGTSDVSDITGFQTGLLGLGSTLGIAAQAACLLPVLRSVGFRFRFRRDLRGQGLATPVRLAAWTIGFVLVNQAWLLVASRITTGAAADAKALGQSAGIGYTTYLTAYLIFQLPHSVVVVSLVTALLPQLSRAAAIRDYVVMRRDFSETLRIALVSLAPAAAVFVAVGPRFTEALYGSTFIGWVLVAFGPGLIGFSAHYISLRAFYAQEDTRTPAFVQCVVVAVSVVAAVAAEQVVPLQYRTVAVAGAYGLGYWVGFLINVNLLRARIGGVDGSRVLRTSVRTFLVAVPATVAGWAASAATLHALPVEGRAGALAAGVVGAIAVAVVYLALARLVRLRELDQLLRPIRRRLPGRH